MSLENGKYVLTNNGYAPPASVNNPSYRQQTLKMVLTDKGYDLQGAWTGGQGRGVPTASTLAGAGYEVSGGGQLKFAEPAHLPHHRGLAQRGEIAP